MAAGSGQWFSPPVQPQLQYPMPKLSRFRPLLPHVAMLKKSETPSQASTPLWLLCMAQTFIVPLHRQKRGRCRDSKSMFSVWHSFHQPQTLSPLMCRNVCLCVPLPSILSSLPAMIIYTEILAFWVAKPNCLLLHTCFLNHCDHKGKTRTTHFSKCKYNFPA